MMLKGSKLQYTGMQQYERKEEVDRAAVADEVKNIERVR